MAAMGGDDDTSSERNLYACMIEWTETVHAQCIVSSITFLNLPQPFFQKKSCEISSCMVCDSYVYRQVCNMNACVQSKCGYIVLYDEINSSRLLCHW